VNDGTAHRTITRRVRKPCTRHPAPGPDASGWRWLRHFRAVRNCSDCGEATKTVCVECLAKALNLPAELLEQANGDDRRADR
jgi:hypothetical protein